MQDVSSRLFTLDEVTERLGIGRTKAYELIEERQIEAVKLGRRTLVTEKSLTQFIAELPRVRA